MFSRKEREFLETLSRGRLDDPRTARALEAAFPNPAYRRKLLWGIRRKVEGAMDDWRLFLVASRAEKKVWPRPSTPREDDVPLFSDPLAAALLGLERRRQGRAPERAKGPTSGKRRRQGGA